MNNEYEVRGEVTAIFLRYKGKVYETLIDTEDLHLANSYPNTWFMQYDPNTSGYYIIGRWIKDWKTFRYRLHRTIMNALDDRVVDHINHDTLDNRKSNLRLITVQQNNQNKKMTVNNKSGVRGVHYEKESGKYKAQITINGKRTSIGRFNNLEDATLAFEVERKKHMPYSNEAS